MKSGWVPLKEHLQALTEANDRRYTEVNIEKEKALKIKEEGDKEARRIKDLADETALDLARQIQTYKDEAHNGLLKQWQAERGSYVTSDKFDGAIKPLVEFMNSQRGQSTGRKDFWGYIAGAVGLAVGIIGIASYFK